MIELGRVFAANAGAGWTTEAIVGEAFAVELEALRLATIAGL